MPSETFYNLPPQKRQKLIAAIKQELSRVPLQDASINRIVQNAGISRGSYYQYFRDRHDLCAFLIQDYSDAMQRCAREALESSHGDLFKALLAGYDESIRFSASCADAKVFMGLFTFHGAEDDQAINGMVLDSVGKLISENLDLIDKSTLCCDEADDLMQILEILFALLKPALFELFNNPSDAARQRKRFRRKLEIVQYGMRRRDASAKRSISC